MTYRQKFTGGIHSGLFLKGCEQRRTNLADNFRIRRCSLIIFSTDPALILTPSATFRTVMLRSSKIAASTWLTVSSSEIVLTMLCMLGLFSKEQLIFWPYCDFVRVDLCIVKILALH